MITVLCFFVFHPRLSLGHVLLIYKILTKPFFPLGCGSSSVLCVFVFVIEGKGVPDVNSRLMVRKLWETLRIPIFALVDADPHGSSECKSVLLSRILFMLHHMYQHPVRLSSPCTHSWVACPAKLANLSTCVVRHGGCCDHYSHWRDLVQEGWLSFHTSNLFFPPSFCMARHICNALLCSKLCCASRRIIALVCW